MYRAFNVTDCNWKSGHEEAGKAVYQENKASANATLEAAFDGDVLDATSLAKEWFPQIEADVFISHSHLNQDQAIACAGWLQEELGLSAFVDSCVWGNAQSLLATIDNEYCLNSNGLTYNYQKRNHSTAHVHLMLSSALQSMLDKAECVFFLNTPQSITPQASISKTQSPWLFFELNSISLLRRRKPERERRTMLERDLSKAATLTVEFEVSLESLTQISKDEVNNWRNLFRIQQNKGNTRHVLDLLYDMAPE